MTKADFLKMVQEKIVLLDGATGSNMQKNGMPTGVCPEKWILDNPQVLIDLQKGYVEAGTDILYAPTFTSSRIKLEEYGLAEDIEDMNRGLVKLSKKAVAEADIPAERKVYIAADLTMTGRQLYPIGDLKFEELVDVYKEQIAYILMEGVDLFVIETMMSLQECRAAVLAVKETCDLPVMVTLTFNDNNRTLYGTDPVTAVTVLQNMGVDAVGVNCSTGPEKMCEVVAAMKAYATVPIIAKPNAGLPVLKDNETVFSMGPEEFAKKAAKLVEAGASIVGGCCGTTIKHIKLLEKAVATYKPHVLSSRKKRILTTERRSLKLDIDGRFMILGERINPTGKKALQEELKADCLNMVVDMAKEQEENGADILDVNMGMNGIDEKEMMVKVVNELTAVTELPLSIDSSHISVIEAALRIYPGRALINSISLEKGKMEKLLPVAKKYGAMFILLPLSEKGLPKDLNEKKEIINTIVKAATDIGLSKEDIVVDGLVNTVGANKAAALETMETIRYCKEELELATVVGLSNISFGLPERQYINSTFLAFAIQAGLTMAIANPSQDLLMNTAFASDLLKGKEDADLRYINRVTSRPTVTVGKAVPTAKGTLSDLSGAREINLEGTDLLVFDSVVKGNKRNILQYVKQSLEEGREPSFILDNLLIPGINKVGQLFDKQIYFLPQLISSAEAMKIAIEHLEPLLKKGDKEKKLATVVIATVSGDVHDIGKNLVVLMLKNYGFHVIDLGKDVPSEKIIETAMSENADIIALSALMTTTMLEMKQVIALKKESGLKAKIIIGGAVITQSYADEIGADGFAADAGETVTLVKRLLNL
ncbi:vitamin B12-dependent methionine synthase [Anaerocolumna cellulosilytica]|uniref:Methionine synthase n=1 Tax=Anaerocolumna cellulosilytica TaxID=433286 RepID=A0A6S6R311_9FIRM|nr:homocysteine S-methyltransferase family protein [Anaerocolumna cellulosilytica]MBB5195992.1 5-methyltetrahydrofolate--homocysteine methyltransferase [Anaerocolumna cellulosilytica]BCJ93710.1 vitamin B12-dependent methionine synthase [Anaerocolumna cellulosilytica]